MAIRVLFNSWTVAVLDTKSPTQSRAGLDGGAVRHTIHCFITKKSGLIAFEANRFINLSDSMTDDGA